MNSQVREDIERAIATVADSRRSHESWLIWYERNPGEEARHAETCGDAEWHRQCIAGYDHVLAVLRGFMNTRHGGE